MSATSDFHWPGTGGSGRHHDRRLHHRNRRHVSALAAQVLLVGHALHSLEGADAEKRQAPNQAARSGSEPVAALLKLEVAK
jgi:hypothetical protein